MNKISVSTFQKTVILFIFFFITLQSYYFYEIGLAPFPIISFIGIFLLSFRKPISKYVSKVSLSLFLVFITSATWGYLVKLDYYYFNSLLGILLGPVVLIYSVVLFKKIPVAVVHRILYFVLTIHMVCFFVQFISFLFFGQRVDYLEVVTGESSRFEAYGPITGLIRATGLFNEPATYSYYIFILIYMRFYCFKSINWFDQLALFTILLTLSLSGFILYVFFQVYYRVIFQRNIGSIFLFIILTFIVILIVQILFDDALYLYISSRLSEASDDNSINTRFSDGIVYFISLPFFYVLFGLGIGNYSDFISTSASGWMSFITTFGILPGLVISILVYNYLKFSKIKFFYFCPFIVLLFSTITPMHIIFWFTLAFLSIKTKILS